MKASSEKIESCQVALTVEVEPEELEQAMDEAYRRMAKKVNIPGFRKGKAPRELFERHVGKDSIESEALEQLVPQLYQEAIEQEQITSIGQPDMEIVQKDPPIFKATIPVPPEVELGDYHSVRVSTEPIEITEENIEQGIENLRRMHATLEPVERPAQLGDVVTIDIKATIDEKTVLDREGDSFRITQDSDVPSPGFAEEISGMNAGDEKDFSLPFPDDHPNEELAGKDCLYHVTVSEIKEEILPELDDEFAKSLGQGIETADELKVKLEQNMRASADRERRNKLESDVIEAISNISTVEFPPVFTDQEIDRLASDQMTRMGGMQLEDFLRYRGITEEEFRNELRPIAERRVRSSLILNKVYEKEGIEVSEEELTAEIDRVISEAGEQGEGFRAIFDTPDARESVRGRLLTEKTLNLLIDIATSSEEPSTPGEGPEETSEEEAPQQTETEEEIDNEA